MKRLPLILAIITATICSSTAQAFNYKGSEQQAPDHWWAVGLSGYPTVGIFGHLGYYDYIYNIKRMYADYDGASYSLGNISAEYGWNFSRAFSLALNAGFTPIWNSRFDGYTHERKSVNFASVIYFTGEARFTYVNKPKFRFYSSVELGMGAGIKTGDNGGSDASFVLQVNPLGFEFGDKWFGRVKFGVGVENIGAQIGFGHRF